MGHTLQVPSQLSSHLRALRKAKGLSQAALGARLGLSQARIARIEGEPLSISVEQLLRVLAALGVGVTLEPLQVQSPQGAKGDVGTLPATSTAKRAKAKPDW
jgi:HTH-type transcriptional regulator / antitoxin HipB